MGTIGDNARMSDDTVYAALLRGINLGARNKVPMAALRRTVESVGCTDVSTYIQSGNVVLSSPLSAANLRAALEQAVADQLGVGSTVMVRSAKEMADVVARTPYPDAADGTVHVGFLHEPPGTESADRLTGIDAGEESLRLVGRELYLHLPVGLGRSALMAQLGKRFKDPMTVRNWRTVTRVNQMCASP